MGKHEFSFWWAFNCFLLVLIIAITAFLNFNHPGNDQSNSDAIRIDNGDTKINWDSYPTYDLQLAGDHNITAPGTYHVSGSTDNGKISISLNNGGVVKLVLDNVSIKNPSGPAIICSSGDDLVIESRGVSYLEDGASYDSSLDEDIDGVIYSKADLILTGDGTLKVSANHQDGIVGKDDLKINGGLYEIVAVDDGVRGKDSVYIVDGKIILSVRGDAIKSTNDKEIDKGFVLIAGGEINITKSYEGLEARKIIIDNGRLSINSSDDGINASEEIHINNGDIYINSAGDGIDSNGYVYINGGTTIVDGPTSSGNGALDSDNPITMNGGLVIAVGAAGMAKDLGDASSINNVSIFFGSAFPQNTKVDIKTVDGDDVISFTSAKTFSHMAVGSPLLKFGNTYIIYINGVKYDQFTISNVVTTVGKNTSMMPGGANAAPNNPRKER